jgi:TPR repeat protein
VQAVAGIFIGTKTMKPSRINVRWAVLLIVLLGAITVQAQSPGEALEGEVDLAEIVRRPAYGTYIGYAEFKMARYASARRIWEALDARDYGDATFNLGILYEDGLGVDKNPAQALSYYRRGAQLGSQKSMFRAGLIYWHGARGVAQDRVEARRFLEMAAAAGDTDAPRYLAEAGETDPVLRADQLAAEGRPAEAFATLSQAASVGNVLAQTRLAWAYEAGRGVTRDLDLAAQWFRRAADAGNGEAMYALAVMHATGAGQEKSAERSADWLRKSAAAGYAPALAELKRQDDK